MYVPPAGSGLPRSKPSELISVEAVRGAIAMVKQGMEQLIVFSEVYAPLVSTPVFAHLKQGAKAAGHSIREPGASSSSSNPLLDALKLPAGQQLVRFLRCVTQYIMPCITGRRCSNGNTIMLLQLLAHKYTCFDVCCTT